MYQTLGRHFDQSGAMALAITPPDFVITVTSRTLERDAASAEARAIAASTPARRPTQLYDRRREELSLDEAERIRV